MEALPESNRSQLDETRSRAALYALLSRLWLREVDAALLEQLKAAPIVDLFRDAGGPAAAAGETVDRLAEDYCQLFLGPSNHLPPVQSVWESGQFQGESASATQRFTDLLSPPFEYPEGVMPDHLGVQLGVASRLLEAMASCNDVGDKAEIEQILEAFLPAHLAWATQAELLELAASRAETAFYRGLATLTREFLETELN